jgi:diguanylate cyclase (GGDEF)-like protein/PAS domain S-box-containing protein
MELAESEDKLRKVLDVMPAGVVVVDRAGNLTDSNLSAERILGETREDLLARNLGSPDWHALRPDGSPMSPEEFPGMCALRERCAVLNVEMGILQGNAVPRWLIVNAVPMDTEDGPAVIVFSDISEGKRQQQLLAASEKRFRILFESFTEMVFVLDTSGHFAMVHLPRQVAMDESDAATWIGRNMREVFPGSASAALTDILTLVLGDGEPRTAEVELDLPGEPRHYLATISPLQGETSQPEGFVLVLRDVTTERATAESLRVAATTFESQEGMMITDGRGTIMRVNRAFSDLTGYEAEEVVGRSPAVLKSGRQGDDFYRGMWETLTQSGYWQGEVWNRRKSGEVFPEWLTISAVKDDAGRTTHYVGAFSDITERKEAEERIRNLAFYDPLTSLPNRRLLLDRLHQALAAGQRAGNYGAILYLDLDHFKVLNDTRGHDAGDELLVLMAERLQAAVREQDTVARLGGDEFVVMLEDLDQVQTAAAGYAGAVAEKIREALQKPFPLTGGDHTLTPSIGVSLFRGHETDVQTLLKQADMALYEAKEQGRNTVRFFSHEMQEAVSAQAAILEGLRRALDHEEFELYLQPQFGGDGVQTGAEALLRWHPPGGALIPPDEFIPYAEDSGLIVPIGNWVLERACEVLATWRESRPDECLSVNVSARQFHQQDFVDTVAAALARHGVDGSRLCLELTETAVLGDTEFAACSMERLNAMGVIISLDDFGTGYSSLSNLRRLPIGEVKIDRTFVQEVTRNEQDAAIVRAIISMCRNLGMRVVAEGVETEAQKDFLQQCRCDMLQGFLLGRPAPIDPVDGDKHDAG